MASLGAQQCYAPRPRPFPLPRTLPRSPSGEDPASRQAVVVTVFAKGRLDIHVQPTEETTTAGPWGSDRRVDQRAGSPGRLCLCGGGQPAADALPPPQELIETWSTAGRGVRRRVRGDRTCSYSVRDGFGPDLDALALSKRTRKRSPTRMLELILTTVPGSPGYAAGTSHWRVASGYDVSSTEHAHCWFLLRPGYHVSDIKRNDPYLYWAGV